jgi:hypothetical protein
MEDMDSTPFVDDSMNDTIAASFTAQVHVKHFKTVFNDYYRLDLSDWAKAAIADNAATNHKAAKILELVQGR